MNNKESLELEQQIRLENVLVKKTYTINKFRTIVKCIVFSCLLFCTMSFSCLLGYLLAERKDGAYILFIMLVLLTLMFVSSMVEKNSRLNKLELNITSNDIYIRNIERMFLFFTNEIWIKSCAIKDIASCEIGASGDLYFKYTEDGIKKYLSEYKKELLEEDKLEEDENLKLTAKELEETLLEANENIRKEGELMCSLYGLNKKSRHDICDTINKYIRK